MEFPILKESYLLLCLQKLFGHQMSNFHITMEGMWSNSGKWKTFDDNPEPIIPYRVKVKRKYHQSQIVFLSIIFQTARCSNVGVS